MLFPLSGTFAAVETLAGSINDDEAIKQAKRLFQDFLGKFSEFEVWDGDRLVYRFIMDEEDHLDLNT